MFTTQLPTKPGKYWVRNAPVMQGLGLKKTDIMDVFWIRGYNEERDKDDRTLCVGIRGWDESISEFIARDKIHPEWCGPLTPPE
jgi:hypothetical protein